MISKNPTFARFSRPTCWVVSAIWLVIALLVLTGNDENNLITGLLWLAGAAIFAISALLLGKNAADNAADNESTS
ncbi:MAG: hypothetical protein RQ757_05995 [Pseudomonadales bacterium]|nr:hypothetical protein [Pseudomonadales bacterium]